MTLSPVVEHELRRAVRRPALYRVRMGAAGFATFLSMAIYLASARGWLNPTTAGRNLFQAMCPLAGLYCLLAGLFHTADCISEERREGTLGLLFLTQLRGYDVIFGKLVGNSLNCFFGLLATLPLLALSLLLGGVMWDECLRVTLSLMNTLFLSLVTGIFVSSFSTDARKALCGTFLLLVTEAVEAAGSYHCGLGPQYQLSKVPFWLLLALGQFVSWALVAAACASISSIRRERGRGAADKIDSLPYWAGGCGARILAKRLADADPSYWLGVRDLRLMAQFSAWTLAASTTCLLLNWKMKPLWGAAVTVTILPFLLHTFLKCLIALEASRRTAEERATGALEILFTTGLGPDKLVERHLIALKRLFVGPILIVLSLDLWLFVANVHDFEAWTVGCIIGGLILIADAYALSWTGIYFGLVARNATRAWCRSMVSILILPWLAAICFLAVVALFFEGSIPPPQVPFWLISGWLLSSLMVDLGFCAWAIAKLGDDLPNLPWR